MNVTIKKCNKLEGSIKISGSKNSALPLLAISLLTKQKLTFTNVPMITDIYNMIKSLKELGVKVNLDYQNNKVVLKRKKVKKELSSEVAKKIRASYYLYPGLIHLNKKCKVIKPGGCNFTNRPIDYHLKMFEASGVKVQSDDNFIYFQRKKLKQTTIRFNTPTVGGTINALLHFVLVKGTTVIKDQPIEPEIKEVINCLSSMGANINIRDNNIIIKGVRKLKGVTYQVMPDRIELGSYLLLASSVKSNVCLKNINKDSFAYLEPYLNKLNINYLYNKEGLIITQSNEVNGCDIKASSFPYFPTDLQPILCALLLTSNSKSTIYDDIYPNRISHVKEMQKLKASINVSNNIITIYPSMLEGSKVYAHDLRCGFALIVCACLSKGETIIENFEVINRGYENIILKLKSIGVQINEN